MTGSLFDDYSPTPPSQRHSATSIDAAEAIVPLAGRLRRRVYEWLVSRGETGGTDEEIQDALDMPSSTERPRRVELVRAGLVIDSGRTRPTRSGRNAVVWSTDPAVAVPF